ncbi:Formyltetrahydrofolate deformylase [Candidatus Erwinia haradaeae]|uniref:Formyltetrahydrofolate deformylase n=1 Tax=Candidatus Erwinia haradaeae TaxID=1922217 RepID=A0A451CZQ0_9GAMM|nr:formyltetrahydrofolate deformylase [Candidatus Erwinia haradaeae]VFP78912.1 Formyltetrahydrofolate deformylase [Candidatus Erwinia haradaeae]
MIKPSLQRRILHVVSSDSKGLLSKITNMCYRNELNILENNQFVDDDTNLFFMRTDLEGYFDNNKFLKDLDYVLPIGSRSELHSLRRQRIVILASQETHCVGELLMKSAYNELDLDIAVVISNHETLRSLVTCFNIPFIFSNHKSFTRVQHDNNIADKIDFYCPDYIVLAKYMRVLTEDFVHRYKNKIINIHHSFLPAFIGSRPYHQAYNRGVKMIGATAHYVNEDLDGGAIIIQDVIPIDHSYNPEDMRRACRDVEKNVLTRALYQIVTQRVFLNGNRTILL